MLSAERSERIEIRSDDTTLSFYLLHECVGEVIHRNWRFNLIAQIAQLVRAYPSLKDSLSVGAGSNPVLGVIFPISFHCNISSVLFSFAPYLVQGSLPVLLILELCLCIVKNCSRLFLKMLFVWWIKRLYCFAFLLYPSASQFRLIFT